MSRKPSSKTSPRLSRLATEQPNAKSSSLDTKSALQIARIMNEEDARVAPCIKRALPRIAQAMDAVANALAGGGRLIYVGAGTSGRIAALDASECPPTFNVAPEKVQFVIAGGAKALISAAEYNEDSRASGRADIAKKRPGRKDVVCGIAASGRTPYTVAAVEYARRRGARTIAIACAPGSALAEAAEIAIEVTLGPEVLSGSTRLKAGTAQKMICNMLTTGAMARLGYVYGNLMVNVHLKNEKLRERGLGILMKAADVERDVAARALRASGDHVAAALIMLKAGVNASRAKKLLQSANGHVRQAIQVATGDTASTQSARGRSASRS